MAFVDATFTSFASCGRSSFHGRIERLLGTFDVDDDHPLRAAGDVGVRARDVDAARVGDGDASRRCADAIGSVMSTSCKPSRVVTNA